MNGSGAESGQLDGVLEYARAHPAMLVVLSAASAWLAYEGVKRRVPQAVYGASVDALHATEEGISRAARFAADEAATVAELAKNSYEGAILPVRRGASTVADTIVEGASAIGRGTQRTAAMGRDAAGDVWENHPLVSALALLGAGIAVGMSLPAIFAERSLIGGPSSALLGRARTAGTAALSRGKRMASTAIRDGTAVIAQEAERVGLTPDRLASKVRRIAQRVGETVSDVSEKE